MGAQVTLFVCLDRPGSAKNVACRVSVLTHVCSGHCLVYLPLPCPVVDVAKSREGWQKMKRNSGLELVSCLGTGTSGPAECGLK